MSASEDDWPNTDFCHVLGEVQSLETDARQNLHTLLRDRDASAEHSVNNQDDRSRVKEQYFERFPRREREKTLGVTVVAAVEYAKACGLKYRKRENSYEIVRYVGEQSKKGLTMPVVMMSRTNTLGCDDLKPADHGTVYTLSALFKKIISMPCFHLIIRGGSGFGTPREQVRYLGVYAAHDPQMSVHPDKFMSLPAKDRYTVVSFHQARGEVSKEAVQDWYKTGQQQLRMMVLECKKFDRGFYVGLLAADTTTPVPVTGPRKQHPNWRGLHEKEQKETALQAADQSEGGLHA